MSEIPISIKENMIKDYNNGMSVRAVSIKYNYSYDKTRREFKKQNIKIRGNDFNSKKYKNNSNVFDEIDTEEKAYWLGFLYADGCIINHCNNLVLSLALSEKDYNHLVLFQCFLETDKPIHTYSGNHNNKYCRLVITDRHLCNELIEKGCFQRKTGKVTFPKFLPNELIRHFIRGYVDGNGCITYHMCGKNKNRFAFAIKIDSTKEMLYEFNKFLPVKNKKDIPTLGKRRKNEVNDYSLEFGGNKQTLNILNYLYNDSNIYLQRKYDKYLLLKNMYSQ